MSLLSLILSSKITSQTAPAITGFGAAALLRGSYTDLPLWVVAIVITASLMFGILAKIGRTPPKSVKSVLFQTGALWVVAFWLTESYASSLAGATLMCLGIGLAGHKALEIVERAVVAGLSRVELVFGGGTNTDAEE